MTECPNSGKRLLSNNPLPLVDRIQHAFDSVVQFLNLLSLISKLNNPFIF